MSCVSNCRPFRAELLLAPHPTEERIEFAPTYRLMTAYLVTPLFLVVAFFAAGQWVLSCPPVTDGNGGSSSSGSVSQRWPTAGCCLACVPLRLRDPRALRLLSSLLVDLSWTVLPLLVCSALFCGAALIAVRCVRTSELGFSPGDARSVLEVAGAAVGTGDEEAVRFAGGASWADTGNSVVAFGISAFGLPAAAVGMLLGRALLTGAC
jgi:hypothetical protein